MTKETPTGVASVKRRMKSNGQTNGRTDASLCEARGHNVFEDILNTKGQKIVIGIEVYILRPFCPSDVSVTVVQTL